MPLVRIEIIKGKMADCKKRFEEITKKLSEQLDIQPTDVFIVINNPPNENWELAGK